MSAERRLSPRKEVILRALVEEYIRTAEPVASKQISDQLARIHGPGYASATVRNELVALEEEGLIYQPHISAGRTPTDLGYRYFVERLMGESQLAPQEQRLIRHQFYQVQHQLDEWVRLTASIMAQALQSAAIITPPRGSQARLKHFELLSLYDAVALLVLVLEDGAVRQERLLLDTPTTQEELSRLAQRFNDRFHGADAQFVSQCAEVETESISPNELLVLESLARMLSHLDVFSPDAFYHDGITQLLQRDEFTHADPERIRKVVEVLEHSRFLPAIAPQVMAAEGVQVIIGSENPSDDLRDMSIVLSRYGVEGQVGGLLGIVGPTRMQYGRAIAVVRYMTQMLNDLLSDMYGS
jgi:heat-inducible transcriptional repressor